MLLAERKLQNCCRMRRKTDIEKTSWRFQEIGKHYSQKFEAKQSVTQRHFY